MYWSFSQFSHSVQFSSVAQSCLTLCDPKELDTTERLHFQFSLSCIGEGNGNPIQYSCLENPRDGAAWWAALYGVTQSRTRLKRLSSSSSSSRLVIAFLPRSKHLFMAAVTICSDSGAQENKVRHCFNHFPIYFPWNDGTGYHDLGLNDFPVPIERV